MINPFTSAVVVSSHVTTLLWSECDEDGTPLDDMFDESDIDHDSIAAISREVIAWLDAYADLVAECLTVRTPGQLGHDLALTRNHHGAGFWDRGLGELGDKLTDAAHDMGTINLIPLGDGTLIAE